MTTQPLNSSFRFPIRYKILFLALAVVVFSSALNIYFSSQLIIEDKNTYFYDYITTQAKLTGVLLENSTGSLDQNKIENTCLAGTTTIVFKEDREIAFQDSKDQDIPTQALSDPQLIDFILKSEFRSGAKTWTLPSGEKAIIGYYKTQPSGHVVVKAIRSELALLAKKNLIFQTLLFGLSVLLIAAGAALLLARALTKKISILAGATQQVSEGNFAVEMKDALGNDEISELSKAFQTMIQKIQELIQKTAHTARMEGELVTAKLVQESFFPDQTSPSPIIDIAGYFQPATECSGDWWHYYKIGPYYLIVVGDVTGHGASAALITASVYSAYRIFLDSIEPSASPDHILRSLIQMLNKAVYNASKGNSSMSLIAMVISEETHESWISNCSHRPPYLVSHGNHEAQSVALKKSPQLGASPEIEVEVEPLLPQNQSIILLTDGVLETAGASPRPLASKGFIKILKSLTQDQNAAVIREEILEALKEHIGEDLRQEEDDLTFVVIRPHYATSLAN